MSKANRYEDAPMQVKDQVREILTKSFPELSDAKINVTFDLRKRVSSGRIVLGRMAATTELLKYLTADNQSGLGIDYILFLDKKTFEKIDEEDQVRLIRHELQHCFVDHGKDGVPIYRCKDHDFTDFYAEVEYNKTDPRWLDRVSVVAESVHDPENE